MTNNLQIHQREVFTTGEFKQNGLKNHIWHIPYENV